MAGPASVDPAVPAQAKAQGGQTGGEKQSWEPRKRLKDHEMGNNTKISKQKQACEAGHAAASGLARGRKNWNVDIKGQKSEQKRKSKLRNY